MLFLAPWQNWHAVLKPGVWLLCLSPVLYQLLRLLTGDVGANPVEDLIRITGIWALRGLWIVLSLTPLQVIMGWSALARLRRLLGLFAFFYAALHVSAYAWLDMAWSWAAIWVDVQQRWFILAGAIAFLLLLVLAVSSCTAFVRALGGRRWKRLHQMVHALAWLTLLHFFWMRSGKNDVTEVAVYAYILIGLQAWRIQRYVRFVLRSRAAKG